MRSCEYLRVSGERRTKVLELCHIRFFKEKRELRHSDPNLHSASIVSITFELQNKETKFDTITHHRSNHKVICPVIIWARIVKRIRSYPNSSDHSKVNTYRDNHGKIHLLSGTQLLKQVCLAATAIGHETLGFHPKDIGLHSAQSGAAMAMYLAGVPVVTIMLLGRWSSNAFLRYIHKQVKEFSSGISRKMLTKDKFFTIPVASTEDPRISGNPLNLTKKNNGLPFTEAALPLLSIFH
jgi:hypothetical protein